MPRDEVLSGELREEMFAANLSEVARGQGHDIYRDPDLFFANTYLTERVRTFFHEVVGRLSGSDSTAAGFYRLDTPFGGGKDAHPHRTLSPLGFQAIGPIHERYRPESG